MPSRYESCFHGLVWDPICQNVAGFAAFQWLDPSEEVPGNQGSTGGCCNWVHLVNLDHCEAHVDEEVVGK